MSKKKWKVSECDKELAARISQDCNINPFAALIAVSRGICSDKEIQSFFFSENSELSDPFDLIDMDKAAARINDAIDSFEKIAVFGDYDADGVTATALLCSYLEMREANFFYILPTRDEGYGLSVDTIDRLHSLGASLIVTVDNGINSVEEAAYASSLGIDMVITDHHRTGSTLPNVCAVVNPQRADCTSKFKYLAGVGVAFKLVCALEGGGEEMLDEFADLVTIGTIGDIIPLVGENRAIVRRGIEQMNFNPRPGIAAMKAISGNSEKPLTSTSVAFTIAPRLNAAGRMGSPKRALEILLCEDEALSMQLAEEIEGANIERQKTETEIFALANEQLLSDSQRKNDRVIVCSGECWHNGVIGIVASRMVEKYGRPCIIITCDGSSAKGSGRSLEGFSLYDALSASSECLTKFGGHMQAAGLSLESSRIDEFRKKINNYARTVEMPFPVQKIDFKLNPKYINVDLLDALDALEPFGAGNPTPVFGLFHMTIDSVTPLSGGKHLRLNLSKKDTKINAVRFGISPENFPFRRGDIVDLAVTLGANEYLGEVRIGIYIKGVRYSGFAYDDYFDGLRAYSDFICGDKPSLPDASALVPDRNFVAAIYKSLRAAESFRSADAICLATQNMGSGICPVMLSVDALCELGLASRSESGEIKLISPAPKVSLDDSSTLKKALRCLSAL